MGWKCPDKMRVKGLYERLTRRKHITAAEVAETKMERCLNTFDLTLLGIGSTMGVGIYIIVGEVASEVAGPAVVLSFFTAALASFLAGLCYAEFSARVPRAGSAYLFSYLTVGELVAFVIGWTLVLEYVIGASSVASGLSKYIDSLCGHAISSWLRHTMPINLPFLAAYPDIIAFAVVLLMTVIIAAGTKEMAIINTVFTVINILVIAYIIICGLFKLDIDNWNIPKDEVPGSVKENGEGGFFPFGLSGMFAGAAVCFYAFVGFDVIATSGEEAINPSRSLPLSMLLSLSVCLFAYSAVSIVLTLMVPYYNISSEAGVVDVFTQVGWKAATYGITAGAICAMSASLVASVYPMPRILYAMASDGLLFPFLASINSRFQTPMVATLLSGGLAAVMALLLSLEDLIHMMAIGTLLAYTLVSASVLILRYEVDVPDLSKPDQTEMPVLQSSVPKYIHFVP